MKISFSIENQSINRFPFPIEGIVQLAKECSSSTRWKERKSILKFIRQRWPSPKRTRKSRWSRTSTWSTPAFDWPSKSQLVCQARSISKSTTQLGFVHQNCPPFWMQLLCDPVACWFGRQRTDHRLRCPPYDCAQWYEKTKIDKLR